ncbi:2-hydroxyacid dehydrogenase [Allobacillus sp. GCM10007491]|uniref:D-glycerate dehydrogenase n=1 Tax=Allobacillus saliphilus TaxID=2912308 RepID=A0A941CW13_9BACI|nr:D-glycerate dehydrogenase [Allobacillus saliphilus]MBR7553576.1 D-glycerate dehydrogenase [Allobacillus saliphilus]
MAKPIVYVTRKLPNEIISELTEKYQVKMWEEEEVPVPRDVLMKEITEANAVLSMLTDTFDEELLNMASELKIIANLAVGYDNIDLKACTSRGITVTNTPDVLTETTADLTFGLLLAVARRIPESVDVIRNDEWKTWSPYMMAGSDVHQKTIGIVGMGSIGEAVAKRATGFDMNILYHNRNRKPKAEEKLGASYASLEELLAKSDFVVSMLPLTKETKGMFDAQAFDRMKQSAFFINASRGGVVNEADLYQAIKGEKIQGAGLDVFANEPIGSNHPLAQLDRVVALPHIGSSTVDTRNRMAMLCVENIKHVLDGMEPLTPVKI